jgi:DNA-binding transcriptional regulator YiaG
MDAADSRFQNSSLESSRCGYTQGSFAQAIGVSLKTVQNWEQRRRKPTGPARALLVVIAHDPVTFANAIRVRLAEPSP